ncbi:NAD(P)/FAD-dependent oxidoreductase [Pseudonocardia sp. CA-142604]|uniref:NAD(P)/FAD-dependent oxidoreductase n=1 Tax=Pseudonocardia sp. CA-142604 TaxID=3240024 RepID=UPI003D8B3751
MQTGPSDLAGVPHVVGAVTGDGQEVRADLVIDAGGRRSTLPALLAGLGGPATVEEREDCGFVYFARFFQGEGGFPSLHGAVHMPYNSVSVVTLPQDNGTWSVTLVTSSRDRELRVLRDVDRWTAVARLFPAQAHWLDADPVTDIRVISGIEDRIRHYLVDGRPVVTGVLPVGDAWACTNPSLGRGVSMGLGHAVLLREVLHASSGDSPGQRSLMWAEATGEVFEPWHRHTVAVDRQRLAGIENHRAGTPYQLDDDATATARALQAGARRDPEILRGLLDIGSMQALPSEVLARPGVADRIRTSAADTPQDTPPGPARQDLLDAAGVHPQHPA